VSNPVFRNGLPMQAMLQEYRIEQVLGAGGFGITYRARDTNLDKDVAIKEYLPGELAMRAPDGNVVAQGTSHEAGYQWGLERFLLEARTLAKFSHPHIVRVLRYFEANSTAYMVMDYEKGDPLKTVLQLDPQPPEEKLKALLAPLLEGLAAVHAMGFLHRDIKPDNIFIRADGRPVLIDFGAARQAMGGETKSLTSILTPGYAPLEQYSGEGKQGPWTDLYAMGGVLYRAVADKNPPDAVSRIRGDSLGAGLATVRGKYSEEFIRAVEWAMHLDEKKRPQSVAQWKPAVLAERRTSAPAPRSVERRIVRPVEIEKPRRSRWPLIVVAVLLAVAVAGVWNRQRSKTPDPVQTVPAAPASPAIPAVKKSDDDVQDKIQRFRQEAEAEFRSADANGDGYLSREEAKARFPVLALNFKRVDADGDGRISPREFMQAKRILLERKFGKQNN
jgi:serine/threonine protein kinase